MHTLPLPDSATDEQRALCSKMFEYMNGIDDHEDADEGTEPCESASAREQSPFVSELKPQEELAAFSMSLQQACNMSSLSVCAGDKFSEKDVKRIREGLREYHDPVATIMSEKKIFHGDKKSVSTPGKKSKTMTFEIVTTDKGRKRYCYHTTGLVLMCFRVCAGENSDEGIKSSISPQIKQASEELLSVVKSNKSDSGQLCILLHRLLAAFLTQTPGDDRSKRSIFASCYVASICVTDKIGQRKVSPRFRFGVEVSLRLAGVL